MQLIWPDICDFINKGENLMSHLSGALGIALISLSLLLAGPVAAQTATQKPQQPPAMTPYGMMMPMMGQQDGQSGMMMPMMGHMMGGGMMGMMMTHTDGYLAFLKTELAITAAQETAWNAFAGQLKEHIGQHKSAMPMMTPPSDKKPLTWIERLNMGEARMNTHLEAMKKLRPAAEALYAALSPEQKQKADTLMPGGMGMHMGMMGGMPMMRGMPMHK